ncbi:MAG: transposase, partial [Planctomycetota bacterium]
MKRLQIEDGPGEAYNVSVRVNWGKWLLNPEVCARILIRLLNKCAAEFGVSILAYVLMSNHFHLVCQSPPDPLYRRLTTRVTKNRHRVPWPPHHLKASVLRQLMHQLLWRSSRCIQRELGIKGHLWETSYFATQIQDVTQLLVAVAYDHLNPVVENMTLRPEDHARSSAAWWAGEAPAEVEFLRHPLPFDLEIVDFRASLLALQADKIGVRI